VLPALTQPDMPPVPQPELPPLNRTPALGVAFALGRAEENTGPFATDDGSPAPRFAESYVGPLPAPPGAPAPTGTVPANPFAEISDNTIEYFVAWSLEQSTTPHPKSKPPPEASFANVEIRAPGRERDAQANARLRLIIGVLVGLAFGIPLGAVGMWAFKPSGRGDTALGLPRARTAPPVESAEAARPVVETKQPVIVRPTPEPPPVEKKPPAVPPAEKHASKRSTDEKPASAPAPTPEKPKTTVAKAPSTKPPAPTENPTEPPPPPAATAPPTEKPSDPSPAVAPKAATADEPHPADAPHAADELPSPPSLAVHKGKTATLRVRSTPAGAEVTIKGEPHGVTPVDVELPPNHRYDIVVTLAGKKPWKRRINLAPPLTEVTASLK
jgi:hypothetical protein